MPVSGRELALTARQVRSYRHTESGSGVGDFSQPKRRFRHIHMDVMGPLPPSGPARYLLTIIDRSTRWLKVTPMSEATTHACAEALLSGWISCFSVPQDITLDRGSAFMSEICLSLANLMRPTLHSTTAYNPAANGMVERTLGTLKAALMARCMDELWKAKLPWVVLGLRTAPRADDELSLAEKVYGEALTVPDEFFPATTDDTKLNRFPRCVSFPWTHFCKL
ncbi:uncharacterized protein [Palaemon carinicauda]|uniref:uncharacterized protein n=1 Tax=Palaemon carinicauda TaxID=392227 RepID=UPI0035B673FC